MTDWLVDMQNAIAEYPIWLTTGVGLVIVGGVLFLMGKAFRLIGGIVLIVAVGAVGWLAFQHYFGG